MRFLKTKTGIFQGFFVLLLEVSLVSCPSHVLRGDLIEPGGFLGFSHRGHQNIKSPFSKLKFFSHTEDSSRTPFYILNISATTVAPFNFLKIRDVASSQNSIFDSN